MKIQYASDLHLEFPNNRAILDINKIKPSAPHLILAGDVDVISNGKVSSPSFFKYVSDNWENVYIIPGNHEFYHSSKLNQIFDYSLQIESNVRYINNQSIMIGEAEIFFTTLWSQCTSQVIEQFIADFHLCKWGNQKFTIEQHTKLHFEAVKWLDNAILNSKAKHKIVVSHFVPSHKVDAYPSDNGSRAKLMKQYFVAELDQYLEKWNVDFWIYGHNHFNHDVDIFGIKFRSNMFGYSTQYEHESFLYNKVLEIAD